MIEVLRDATGLGVADMDMQDGRAGVVAVDRLLHLVVPGDGMSSGKVRSIQPRTGVETSAGAPASGEVQIVHSFLNTDLTSRLINGDWPSA